MNNVTNEVLRVAHPETLESTAPVRERPQDDLPEWSKDALYARAKELSIPGRSEMTKAQLIEAIRKV